MVVAETIALKTFTKLVKEYSFSLPPKNYSSYIKSY